MDSHPIYLEFGTGSSPVLCENRLIIVHDNEEHQFIAAFDKSNGKLIWQTDRAPTEGTPAQAPKSGWVTPLVWRNEVRTEIVTMSPGVAISYDLDGKELWRLTGVSVAPAASSFAYDGLLYLDGGKTKPMFAIRPGATGDISLAENEETNDFVVWSRARAGTYIPTPVAYQGGLYVVNDNGIISRYDVKTGKQTFKERIKTSGADFTTSPWAYNGKVFCHSEQGDTYVLKAGSEYELLHVNSLGDMSLSSPAIVDDRLLIRTEKRIYSMRQK
jgi:outer membrane protein assembly factor BamB